MSLFRLDPNPEPEKYLFDGPHWQVDRVMDLELLFGSLLKLVPEGGILCMADAVWSEEGKAFVEARALPAGPRPLTSDFRDHPCFPLDTEHIALLIDLESRHAAPELACHMAVCAGEDCLLSWYDLPWDPISVSLLVPESCVAAFAVSCRVGYRRQGAES